MNTPLFLVVLITSFAAAAAAGTLRNKDEQAALRCRREGDTGKLACTVTLRLDDGSNHDIVLEEDPDSLFSTDAQIINDDGSRMNIKDHSNKDTVRLRSQLQSTGYATAAVLRDGSRLVEGVFAVPNKGFYEFDHGHASPRDGKLRRRLLGDVGEDEQESHPDSFPSSSDKSANDNQEWLNNALKAAPNTYIPFFPGCYELDALTHVMRVNVALDNGIVTNLGGPANLAAILASIESVFAMGRLLYLAQLNIRVEVQTVLLGTSTMAVPFSRSMHDNTCAGANTAFEELMGWLGQENRASQAAYWVLASSCFSGINGKSYVGSMCGSSGNGGVAEYAWPVIFHEMGHSLGMWHSFETADQMGTTGGLMDYGNILYNGLIQFHPFKRAEACGFLEIVTTMAKPCPHFYVADATSSCGDGVLSRVEECECINKSKGCRGCVNCLKTDPTMQCSASEFVMRDQYSAEFVTATADNLASPQCCNNGRAAPAKTLCGDNLLEACGELGRCTKLCTRYLEANNPNCGFDDYGCKLGCIYEGQCQFNIPSDGDPKSPTVNALPDGSQCTYRGLPGQCQNAVCHTSAGTPPPTRGTDAPTRSPFYNERPDTFRPTSFPTTFPTKAPVTARPTDPAARIPTVQPTPKGTVDQEGRCNGMSKSRARCRKRRGCKWCGSSQRCVFDLAANCAPARGKAKHSST